MTSEKQNVLDTTEQRYTWIHRDHDRKKKTYTSSNQENSQHKSRGNMHKVPPLVRKLFANMIWWKEGKLVFSSGVALGISTTTQARHHSHVELANSSSTLCFVVAVVWFVVVVVVLILFGLVFILICLFVFLRERNNKKLSRYGGGRWFLSSWWRGKNMSILYFIKFSNKQKYKNNQNCSFWDVRCQGI